MINISQGKEKFTERQIHYALDHPDIPDNKNKGRNPKINNQMRQQFVGFVCASKKNRRMSYEELAKEFEYWFNLEDQEIREGIGAEAIKNAFDREGFGRRIAMWKPSISEKNCKLRLAFAIAYQGWIYYNWCKIPWSDETWVTDGIYMKIRCYVGLGKNLMRIAMKRRFNTQERMDVLGILLWRYIWAFSVLGQEMRYY